MSTEEGWYWVISEAVCGLLFLIVPLQVLQVLARAYVLLFGKLIDEDTKLRLVDRQFGFGVEALPRVLLLIRIGGLGIVLAAAVHALLIS